MRQVFLRLAALVFLILSPLSVSAQSIDIGGQTCNNVWVLYDYYSNGEYQFSAWEAEGVNCYDNGGSNWSGDIGSGLSGAGGVEIDSAGVWVSVPAAGYAVEVNVIKNQVRTKDVSCGQPQDVLNTVAGRILVKNPLLDSQTIVTVFFADGSQQFLRRGPAGSSMQMLPAPWSKCE